MDVERIRTRAQELAERLHHGRVSGQYVRWFCNHQLDRIEKWAAAHPEQVTSDLVCTSEYLIAMIPATRMAVAA